jgi:hypothetical protein
MAAECSFYCLNLLRHGLVSDIAVNSVMILDEVTGLLLPLIWISPVLFKSDENMLEKYMFVIDHLQSGIKMISRIPVSSSIFLSLEICCPLHSQSSTQTSLFLANHLH